MLVFKDVSVTMHNYNYKKQRKILLISRVRFKGKKEIEKNTFHFHSRDINP
jgi:hypothetical protein